MQEVRVLMMCLFIQAEARAEFAERSVQKLQKEVDRLEGKSYKFRRFITDLLYWLNSVVRIYRLFLSVTKHTNCLVIIYILFIYLFILTLYLPEWLVLLYECTDHRYC
jgi:hypothetical protein